MNKVSKVLFWIFTIGLGFVNPLISIALVFLYYLPGIVQELCQTCKDACNENNQTDYTTEEFIHYEKNGERVSERKSQAKPRKDSYSDDTLEKNR